MKYTFYFDSNEIELVIGLLASLGITSWFIGLF